MYSTFSYIVEQMKTNFKCLLESLLLAERQEYLNANKQTKANGFYTRSLGTHYGDIHDLNIPRTRDGGFRSQLVPRKHSDSSIEKLVSELFIEGLSTRKIVSILETCFDATLSHTAIANIARSAQDEIESWTSRSLNSYYACIFIDAFYFPLKRLNCSQEAVYVAMAITPEGRREILGYWIPGGSEGSSNWEEILREIRTRGTEKVDFIVADGLTGIENAIARVFPEAKYQYCVLHAIRSTENKVRARDKESIALDLKMIYKADSLTEAKTALTIFIEKWQKIYPKITSFWNLNFQQLTQFMILPKELWRYVYTTNWVERTHKEIKRRLKAMEQFQSEGSAEAILYKLYMRQNERLIAGVNGWKKLYAEYLRSMEKLNIAA